MLPAKSEVKWVEVDLGVVRANVRWIRSRLSPKTALMAVVKEDAYGHGGTEISREAIRGGAASLGVLTVREAAALRLAGIKAPIQLLAPALPSSARDIFKWKLIPTIDDLEQARAINAAAPASGAAVHVDLNFGLGRWGIPPRDIEGFLSALFRLKRLHLRGLSTHIDYVPGKNAVEAEEKLSSFSSMAFRLKKRVPDLICHAANSSVLLDFPHRQMDMVRIGNLLYGVKPSSFPVPIKSPWSLKARVVSLRQVERGRSIGYAGEYIAPRR
ncbi:MAG: alanine racemase, partial [Elusimicrobia bacterium]|nr:alanine racemase [Elusimicrobiota bacterium]